MKLNKVYNGKCWAFALKSKKLKIMSNFKIENDDRIYLFFIFVKEYQKQVSMVLSKFFNK